MSLRNTTVKSLTELKWWLVNKQTLCTVQPLDTAAYAGSHNTVNCVGITQNSLCLCIFWCCTSDYKFLHCRTPNGHIHHTVQHASKLTCKSCNRDFIRLISHNVNVQCCRHCINRMVKLFSLVIITPTCGHNMWSKWLGSMKKINK